MDESQAMTTGSRADGEPKLLGLEVLRFTCAMVVLVFHFQHFAMVGDGSGLTRAHEPLGFLLWPIYQYGSFGVELFWCISGFIFYWKYADAIAARAIEARRFFWLRFSRLYPLHFVTLLAVAAMQPLYAALNGNWLVYDNSLVNLVLQLGMADQWAGSRAMSFNGPIWSVSAEVFVYIAFFLLMRAFGRKPWLIAAAIGFGLAGLWTGGSSAPMVCAAFFFAGGAAADWLQSKRATHRPKEARGIALAIILATVLCSSIFVDLEPSNPATPTILLLICPPLLFLLAQDMPLLNRWQRPIRAAGNLTYSTYLIHFPMQLAFAIASLALGFTIPIDQTWFLILYVAVVVAAGRIVFLRFEAPVQDLIRAAMLRPKGSPLPA